MIRRKDQEKKESLKKQLAEKSRELSIEAALEKVRTVALNMREPSDMLKICTTISKQLQRLGVKEIRNVQTAIFYVNRGTYMNYEFYAKHDKTFITETTYGNNKIHRAFARKMLKGKGEFFVSHIRGDKVKEWIKYQESTNVFIDRYLKTTSSLNYYWHSLGPVALGISTYSPLSKEELDLFHRFIRVFDLAYRRYLDIEKAEKQAREAQMEVAVERVRAKALAMHRSDEIHEVVRTLRHELFGLNLGGIMGATICLKQPDGQVRLWDITDIKTTGRYGWDILFDIKSIDPQLWVKKIWDSGKKITATEQDSKDLRRALKWLSRYDKKTAEEISKLLKVNGINHGWHRAVKLTNGVLITDFTKEPPVETETILLKIGAAFDLAYKRFLDLQKAEAQAREAQIEAALERVRSSSMAMHQSGDLHEVIKVVTEQLCGLRLKFDVANFAKVDEAGNWDLWLSTPAQAYPAQLFVPYLDHPIFNRVLDMRKNQLDHISDVYDKKVKNVFFRHFFKNSEAKHSPESRKKQVLSRNGFARTLFYFKNIWFAISNYDGIPFSDQDIEIFRRFAKAFEQSYIRFLDLQRAEAQAREAQIEAALEKVRSRSMAMHRSDELKDVIRLVLQQFGQLNINAEHAGFYIDYKAHEDMHIWLADPNLEPFYAVIPYFDTPTWKSFLEAKANGTILHTDLLDFTTKNKFYRSLFKLFTVPEEAKKFYLKCKGLAVSTVLLDNVGLYIENFSAVPYTDEENNLLIRFGNVFQQTYTRFLDLQKAEAQAREAQIEAALERVRSRTMAMHTSSELIQTAELLFDQLKLLGAELQGVAFAICDKDSVMVQKWTSIGVFSHPYTIEPGEERMYEAWKNQAGMYEEVYEGERQKKYYEAFMQIPAFKQGLQKFIDSGHPLPVWQKNHAVPFKFGYLLFITTKPFNETQIFLRFGKVFEQTYTRFLDLQKAEAQAKEAQIEAALERVRARAMAMHSSQELNEVVHELRKQMGLLGQKALETCVIHLNEESSDFIHSWAAIRPPDREGEILVDSTARVPKKGLRIIEEAMEAYSSNRQDYLLLNEGDKLRQWFSFLEKESPRSYSRLVESVQGKIEDLRAFWSFADFSGGSLLMVTMEQPDELTRGLLRRFANVFGLAYRRFADLKQAEAQAKEAEIQLALERVRARSLAMHHTSELQEVVNVTAQQLLGIGMDINGGVFICINAEVDSGLSIWASGGMADYIEKIVVPFLNKPIFTRIRDSIKKGNAFLIESFTDQEKRELFTHLFQFEPWQSLPRERKEALLSRTGGFARSVVISRHTSISITNHHGKAFSEQENEILKRFGKVFEQSYTRFLDLQKAEAQAREAEIELGLERVRARAMAMQSSEELSTLIGTVFTELTKLDLALTRCIIWVFEPATHAARWWMANSEEPSHPMSFYIKYHEHPAYLTFVREWKNKNVKFIYDLKGQDKLNWDDILFKETELSNLSEVVKNGMKAPERVLLSASFNNFGGINVASLEPLSNEHFDILLRFAKVFDLTYTRFLDLKNAEAQAREAQVEAALERVRAQAMAMRQSGDLLDIVVTMRNEFTRLGHEAHYFWYMRWLPDKYEKAMTSVDGSRIGMIMSLPRHIHGDIPLVSHWEKSEEPALVYAMDVDAAINYVDKMVALGDFELVDPHAPTQDDIRHIQGLTFVMARTMHGEIGYSLPGVVLNPPEEDIKTLVRFANVFDLAYRRFEDLKEAENRNRETQIELALERTRTKTMLMQHSDELLEISEVFHQQLLLLGIDSEFSFVWLPNEEKGDHLFWATWMEEKDGAAVIHTRAITYPLDLTETYTAKCFEDWRSGVPVHEHFIASENIETFFASWEELLEGAGRLKPVFFPEGIYYTEAFMKYGCFGIDIRRPLDQQEKSILHRFAVEFERTYTRFLDLQKAEAQAREATIETALEKVRSRSLAMHKSEELKEVVIVVFEKLKELGLTFDVAGIQLYTAGTRDLVQWVAAPGLVAAPVLANLPFVEEDFKDSEIIQDIWAAKEQGKNIYSKHYSFEEKNKFFAYAGRNNDLNRIPAAAREVQMKAPGYTQSLVAEKHSALWVDSYSGQIISVEEFNVLGRFARVFEQAYVRFLDLQKAEVQAREAQIEAALERVRSRSMGMQRGEDLKGVVKELYEQLKSLGFKMGVAAIQIIDAETGDMDVWMEGSEDGYELPERFHVPYFDHPAHNQHLKYWKSGDPYAVLEISGPDKKSYDHYFFFHTDFVKAPEQTKIFMMSQESLITSMAYMKYGAVGWAPSPLSKEQAVVLQRFAKVFEQTYTRFLDLEKAEAQAREAQIEASLERVRARTMAMHKSSELIDTAELLFDQLRLLGAQSQGVAFAICDKDSTMVQKWTSIGVFSVPYTYEPGEQRMYEAWKNRQEIYEEVYEGDRIKEYYELFMQIPAFKEGIQKFIDSGHPLPTWQKNHAVTFKYGYLLFITTEPFNETQIFLRFGKVFEQTYTRFLDLQKAEAQAREAQIEAALEKIRSRSLAMQRSDELKEVIASVFLRLKELALDFDAAAIQLFKEGSKDGVMWVASPDVISEPLLIHLPYDKDLLEHSEYFNTVWNARTRVEDIINKRYLFDEKNKYYDYVIKYNPQIPAGVGERMLQATSYTHTMIMEKNSALIADSWYEKTLSLDDYTILKRVAKVFEQAYIRFLDLQKAEAQAREAKIEAALERVRSRSMGMQRGEDLKRVVKELYDQLRLLGFKWGAASITIMDEATGDIDWWMEGFEDGYHLPEKYHVPDFDHPGHKQQIDLWKAGSKYAVIEISGPEKKTYDNYYFFQTDFSRAPENTKNLMMSQESVIFSMAYMKYGALSWSPSRLDEEQAAIIQRFANVFEQTYTRFLDLQRAEAQAREAQIEAALEKVRSRSLAMHHSDELREIIGMVYIMLSDLKVKHDTIAIQVFDFETKSAVFWPRNTLQKEAPKVVFPYDGQIMKEDTPHRDLWEAMATGEPILNKVYTKKQKNLWLEYVFIHNDYTVVEEQSRQYLLQLEYLKICFFPERYSGLYAESWDGKNYSAEDIDVLKRAARVFEQAYVRFLDLQKAEAQAREATIEASLERVRSKAMAMHNSQDLATTIQTFYRELNSLNLTPRRCGVGLIDRETRMTEVSTMNTTPEGASMEILGKLILQNHPVLEGVYEHWLAQEEYHPVLRGKEISEYYQLMRPQIQFPDYPLDAVQYGHFFFFDEGGVYAWTEMPLAEDELKIYRRFTSVLSLTYKRYRDLRNAEARAKEAVRQASLDRLRAEIASMRTAADLDRITPLIWKELTTLGIPFVRCGVFIMDEPNNQIHTYLSTPDGRAIAAFHLPLDNPGNLGEAVQYWREHKAYVTRWVDKDFQAQADLLAHLGAVDSRDQYLSNVPTDGIYLHLSPFRQGMLYVGNTAPLSDAELDLVQSLSDAFSVAYARYDDFRQLEMAKKDVENALAGLKQAQQQLVQSEKMASLGELTAGIAHEIQNPLNFVNNFAEVNKELLDEIEEERRKERGERDEHVESEILNAIRQNLEKINFHGKRADGIVKSMLQHSRSGDAGGKSKKEPTDLNKLAEEYLRLAYHGLRAKDKSFNAALHTDFDETMGLIEVSGQDLARVLLNLINNAFYAIQDKEKIMKSRGEAYTPQVSLITKRIGQTVEIRIKDNGPGIPKEVMDKIFQPFFTTKPTGQGTGLGLSLAYDIVKAHGGTIIVNTFNGPPGGEIKTDSTVGEGSEFIIQLPA